MISTEKLFYLNSHLKEFEAVVLDCQSAEDKYKVVLDRTTFFPEGGGQYADTGLINGISVTDVQEEVVAGETIIYHYLESPLEIGSTVKGCIHWEQRFDRMQQHSGEHIVSGIVHSRFGYNNVGFHLGEDYCTMDFDGILTKEDVVSIEMEVNKAVFENLEIHQLFPSKEELLQMDYRSKIEIEGQVRVIDIPGYDLCACCAPHVKHTGEIGLVKLVNLINYKGGVRVFMLSGMRALRDYHMKSVQVKAISGDLSMKEEEVYQGVCNLKDEEFKLKGKIISLKEQLLQTKVRLFTASEIEKQTIIFDPFLEKEEPRELMNLILKQNYDLCCVFTGNDQDGYRYVLGSKTIDVRSISKELNASCDGRGGGKPQMVQGSVKAKETQIRECLRGCYEEN